MQILFDGLTREQADAFGLVLLSAGMPHEIRQDGTDWVLWVEDDALREAETLLRTYLDENRHPETTSETPPPGHGKTWSGIWGAWVLLTCHMAIFLGHDAEAFQDIYGSSARHIVNGEWYRSATALLLHADSLHLAGNLVGMAVFATAVCSITGWGVGWLLILASGISGNLINAYFHAYGHSSIGASTAVFGALGLLSSCQFLKKIRTPAGRFQALLPLGAGLALLVFLGSSVHTDIMAHLFGFLSGVLIGFVYYGFVRAHSGWRVQTGALAIVVAVLVISWLRPMIG